jgi:hypothetical protein
LANHTLHAENRYYLRTLVLILTPAFGLVAATTAISAETGVGRLERLLSAMRSRALARAAFGALLLVSGIHAVETAKFVAVWDHYIQAMRSLDVGSTADPSLGDAGFVSAQRLGPAFDTVAWFSTTPFLSVLVAPNFTPGHLVVDGRANYFWLSCDTARDNVARRSSMPLRSRRLIARFSCLHR